MTQGAGIAAFNFSGGTFQAASSFSTSVPIALNASGSNGVFDTNGNALILAGPISGPGGLEKIGSGTLTLTGSNTYTGPTTVNSGGVLSGTGSLTSVTVNAGGHLAPGDSLGTLSVCGNLILATSAVLDYELDTPSTSDMVSCGSLALNLQQFSDFNFTPTANFGPGIYPLIDFGSISGSLGTSTSGTVDGCRATLGISDNQLVLKVVPEPSTAMLLGIGALGLIGWAWRRGRWKAARQPWIFWKL